MKLIICRECQDVVRLFQEEEKICKCGKSGGKYLDNLNAEYWGPCVPIGFSNISLNAAILCQPLLGRGKEFTAFVISKGCKTMRGIDAPDNR